MIFLENMYNSITRTLSPSINTTYARGGSTRVWGREKTQSFYIQLNSCNPNSYNSNNHVIRTNFPVPSNFLIMYGNSYNSNNHVIRTNFSALREFELHEFYCIYTVNDRLSPGGYFCQNDFLGSIFKV